MGEAQALLPLRCSAKEGRRPLISPRNGVFLLFGAAALCCLAQSLLQEDDAFALVSAQAAHSSLSSAPRAEPASSQGEADQTPSIWSSFFPAEEKPFEPVRDDDRVSAKKAPKVKVDVYMEAACPGCQFFTTHVLVPVMQEEGMSSITDLNIIPAGNAELKVDEQSNKEVVQCQHGEGECEGNRIISCLAKTHKDDPAFVPALGCIEEHAGIASDVFSTLLSNVTAVDMLRNNAGICLSQAKIDVTEVEACSSSAEGDKMLRESIQRTASLTPKFEYAPWVLVDDKAIKDDAYSLKKYICESYRGPLPEACDSSKLKDYFPADRSPVLVEDRDASATKVVKEGNVRGSNKLFKTITGETTQQARQDINSYFKNLGKQVKATAKRERSEKAALRAHPHSALMQELLAGEMSSARRAFMFCAKESHKH